MTQRTVSLAKIHIAKSQLGLDEDTYRALLRRVAGVSSAKDLAPRQIGRVLAEFERLGWKPKAKPQGRARPNPAARRTTLMSKVEALLTEAGRPWEYADGMAAKMFKVERVEWLDDSQLYRLMQALIIDADRHGRL